MSTYNHTPLAAGSALTSANLNSPLSQLDAAIKKNNYVATTAPTVGDDTADGYTVGSRWINVTAQRAYVALSVTLGAAVWKEMTFPSSVAQNFTVTGVLTVVGNTSITGILALIGSQTISTSSGGGIGMTYTGASASSTGPGISMTTNDGAAMGSLDRLGQLGFNGWDGTALSAGAFIISQTTEGWANPGNHGTRITFFTTPNAGVLTLALTINHNLDLDSAGNMNVASGKVYRVAGTQVLAARDTGWAAMTGTPNKNTVYDTATVTLPQLAGRVASIQAAMTTHGSIGT